METLGSIYNLLETLDRIKSFYKLRREGEMETEWAPGRTTESLVMIAPGLVAHRFNSELDLLGSSQHCLHRCS